MFGTYRKNVFKRVVYLPMERNRTSLVPMDRLDREGGANDVVIG